MNSFIHKNLIKINLLNKFNKNAFKCLYELQLSETLNSNLKEECNDLINKIKKMKLCDEALKNTSDEIKLLSLNFQFLNDQCSN